MMIETGFFIFLVCSIFGWLWEVLLNVVFCGCFANRGILYGPWLPIYGFGALMVLYIALNVNNPAQIFVISAASCGLLEYMTSFVMEFIWKMRWWNYTGAFNVNGRINLLVIMVFGIIGLIFYYFIVPRLGWIKSHLVIPSQYVVMFFVGLLIIDFVYAQINPNISAISGNTSISSHRPS